ncbi:hypothetical protein IMSHALPRED_010771 [Imshaugia aleurites]|uniref:DUF6594 domain-containing protein n=1 Tax=Imshaugia aleurites TaxID=172621 RepID=A0A8H3GB53_9LECA|nr:hypothetical protein IMSHALPRED_010771 [Imshaugia aleurites]
MTTVTSQTSEQELPGPLSPSPTLPVDPVQPSQPLPPPGLAVAQPSIHPNQSHWAGPPNFVPQYTAAPVDYPGNVIDFTKLEADQEPWRYSRGYPAMCKWMASDDDFFVLRRFGGLSARILLRQQDRIVKLEEDLQRVDNMCMINGSNNGTFRYDTNFERQRLLDELTSRLEQFQRFLLDHAQIKAQPEATEFQVSNVKRWFANANEKVIQNEEKQFIDKDGDLIPIVSKIKTPLRRFFDKFERPRLWAPFRDIEINERLHGESHDFGLTTTVYSKESVVDKSVTCVTMVLGVAMLVGPLWWLQHLSSQGNLEVRLAVITGFLIVFTILLSILTVARPFEVLAATAAYAAVLMVFMQIST